MRTRSVLLVVLLSIAGAQALAQNGVLPASSPDSSAQFVWPRPFLYGDWYLMEGDMLPSGKAGAGLRIDSDNTISNEKGHERTLESSIYGRFTDGWFAGGGAVWNELSTTNYTQQEFHPSIGGGKDYFYKGCAAKVCRPRWSFLLQADYKLKGVENVDAKGCSLPNGQCANDFQGSMVSFYLPSPTAVRHLFWRETPGIHMFHDAVTSTDPSVITSEESHRSVAAFVELTMMYRTQFAA